MIYVNAAHTPIKDTFVKNGSWAALRGIWIHLSGGWHLISLPFILAGAGTMDFNSNGTMSYTAYGNGPLNWYPPATTTGIGSSFWMKVVKTSGAGHCNLDDGAWHSLAAGLHAANSGGPGASTSDIFLALASDGSGLVSKGSITVNNAI